ncbi:hypothetical protein ACHMWM_24155, partial [Pseudomonas kulmbachensis]
REQARSHWGLTWNRVSTGTFLASKDVRHKIEKTLSDPATASQRWRQNEARRDYFLTCQQLKVHA